jgi:hypothetical protein
MPNFNELFKNKAFLFGFIAVIVLGIYSFMKKQQEKNKVEIVEGTVEEKTPSDMPETSNEVYDLNYVIGYVNDWLNAEKSANVTTEETVNPTSANQDILDAIAGISDKINNMTVTSTNNNTQVTPQPQPEPQPTPAPVVQDTRRFVTVGTWGRDSIYITTLSGIASSNGISLSTLLGFPENSGYRANPNLIHPGDRVRVA